MVYRSYFEQDMFDPDRMGEEELRDIVAGQQAVPVIPAPQQTNTEAVLTNLYRDTFNREPDQSGFDFWKSAMDTQGYTPEMVKQEFLKSPEYQAKQTTPQERDVFDTLQNTGMQETTGRDFAGSRYANIGTNLTESFAPKTTAPATATGAQPKAEWRSDFNPDYTTLPSGFNWQEYLAKNPDLGAAGIDTETEAKRHWLLYGRTENQRPGSVSDFSLADVFKYAEQNLGSNPNAITVDVDPGTGTTVGVGSTINLGGYNITAIGNPVYKEVDAGLDQETGRYLTKQVQVGSEVTGYTIDGIAGKTDKGINYIGNVTVDRNGNVTGRFMDYKTGSDSGIKVWYDAQGRVIDQQGYDESERWRVPAAIGLSFLGTVVGMPGIGEFLSAGTLTGASAAALGGAALGAGTSAISGAEGSNILKGAAVGALSGAIGQGAGQTIGDAAGKAIGGEYANVVSGAVKGGIQALPGAISTGDYRQVGIGALAGGASAAGSGAITEALKEYGIKPTQLQAGINIARAISSGNTNAIIGSLGALTNSKDVNIAAKAYLALNALQKGNPIAATAAIVQLGDALTVGSAKTPTTKFADASSVGGDPFETSAIFEGTEGGGTAEGDFMGLLGTLGDQAGDYPGQEAGPRMFNAEGQMIVAPRGEFLDLPDGRYIDDRGVIFKADGSPWSPSGTATDPYAATGNIVRGDQRVNVTGESLGIEDVGVVGDPNAAEQPPGKLEGLGRIDIQSTPIKDIEDLGTIEIVGKPYEEDTTDLGRIDIVSTPIKDLEELETIEKDDLSDIIKDLKDIVIPAPPKDITTITTGGGSGGGGGGGAGLTPSARIMVPESSGDVFRPGLANVFYAGALDFGPDGQSMADPTDFQGRMRQAKRSMELALEGEAGENQTKDLYEMIADLADERPAETVNELMEMIEGGRNA